ncbi:hypothetical protein I3843_16G109700 [Carya illinoinensis]|nr:hypothetical protein I3843_16G109700 [Carya illinoinensis]
MHDLLQEMGKEIVRQESPKEAGERSRLWFHEDVRHVLEENTGTNKIEAIYLDIPEGHDHMICLPSEAFRKMRNLRLFRNENAQFSTGPNYLSNKLTVFHWAHYPLSSLPSNFRGDNLVEFQMPHSLIKELGGLKFKNLTDMQLWECEFITKIPDLSSSPNLENLDLAGCSNLVEVHHSVGLLDKLKSFFVTECRKLRIFPKRFKLRSLRNFDFTYCSSLEDFPEIECEMRLLSVLNLSGTSIKELPSSIENLKGLKIFYVKGCIDQLGSVRLAEVDGYSQPIINIGKVEEEDGIQSTSSIVSTGEYEIASTTPTNSSIFNDAGSSSSSIWESLQELDLVNCCLSESNFFTYVNYFPALESLDLSGSDIVIFPPHQGVRFPKLDYLRLNNCEELKEILPLPLPSSIKRVEARGCTSLESFALQSKILNNGMDFSNDLDIDLYGCHKLLVIHSWEEGFQSLAYPPFDPPRDISIIFPGMKIPSWFSYRMEARDSNLCKIDINPPHHWNGIDEILVIYVVFGFRSVGIIEPIMKKHSTIDVQILDGSGWRNLQRRRFMDFDWTDFSDHLWMQGILDFRKRVDISRFRFECESELVVFKSVGIHFQKMHEENVRDDIGDHIELGYPFSYSSSEEASSDEKGDRCLDLMDEKRPNSSTMGITITELENEDEYPKEDMDLELKLGYPFSYPFSELENDDENPNEDLELEKDDENPKEIFGKRHRDDEYDCNMEPNRCPQQKRPHIYSSTMGTITEVENDLNLDLELKLGFRA